MVVATSDTRTREQLTYARLILRETLRTGGEGWAAYDRLFREHASLDKSKWMDWTSLDPGLHQATFMRQSGQGGKVCSFCREMDHLDQECALATAQDQVPDRGYSSQERALPPRQVLTTSRDSAFLGTVATAFSCHTVRCNTSARHARRQSTGPKNAPPPLTMPRTNSHISRRPGPRPLEMVHHRLNQ